MTEEFQKTLSTGRVVTIRYESPCEPQDVSPTAYELVPCKLSKEEEEEVQKLAEREHMLRLEDAVQDAWERRQP